MKIHLIFEHKCLSFQDKFYLNGVNELVMESHFVANMTEESVYHGKHFLHYYFFFVIRKHENS